MAFNKHTWVDEVLVSDPNYKITLSDGEVLDEHAYIEVNVDTAVIGTPLNAAMYNDLENRIEKGIDEVRELASSGAGALADRLTTLEGAAVRLTGNQTISGQKTFSVLPIAQQNPTANEHLARKAYVDAQITNAVPQARTAAVAPGNWVAVNENGQALFRASTGITGAGNAFPLLGAVSSHLSQLEATFLQAVNVDGTIFLYTDELPPISVQVTVVLINTR